MKKIAVYARKIKGKNLPVVIKLMHKLDQINHKLVIHKDLFNDMQKHIDFNADVVTFENQKDIVHCSFLISIGGDGTLLDTMRYVRNSGTPVIGFNIGKMGFLANTTIDDIDTALEKILKNEFTIDKRSLIRIEGVQFMPEDINYVLNEIAVLKSDASSMIKIKVFINDYFVNTYWADGLIVSTPTGSTAYSLSCGGPIIDPDTNNFIITPIASHNLTVRPIIISDKSTIKLQVDAEKKPYIINLDSKKIKMHKQTDIILTKEAFYFNLIKLEDFNFYATIRNKLLWGLDKRN